MPTDDQPPIHPPRLFPVRGGPFEGNGQLEVPWSMEPAVEVTLPIPEGGYAVYRRIEGEYVYVETRARGAH